jgi:hypothetical protein
MDWTIDKRSMPAYVRVETTGEASTKSLAAMCDEILESDFWRPGLMVLVDIQKLKPLKNADAITMAGIKYFAKRAALVGKACISTISSHPEYFKYARQFQYGVRLNGCDVVLQLFGTQTQAVAWLDYYWSLHSKEKARVATSSNLK